MGTWGVGLYANDTASDVRDAWLKKLKQGATGEVATAELIEEQGADDDPLFWLALADLQWKWGRLEPRVLERAERALAAGGDLSLWEDSPERPARARVFDRLAAQLKEAPPPPKPVRVRGDDVPWKRGQLWAYRTLDDKYVVFRIAAFDPAAGLVGAPVTELLDVVLESLPPTASLADVPVKAARADSNDDGRFNALAPEHRVSPMFEPKVKRRGELPRHRLKKLRAGGTPRAATAQTAAIGVPWDAMDEFLARRFDVGGLRPGAVLRWPLADGDVAFTMVEFGRFPDTDFAPMWQLAILDCRGADVDATAIAQAKVTRTILVHGFQPRDVREIAHRPIESATQVYGAVYRWHELAERLIDRPEPYRPRHMDFKETRIVLESYLERYRRPYAELVAMLGRSERDLVSGPSGTPYIIEIHFVWAGQPGGAVQVMGGLDDARAEHPLFFVMSNLVVRDAATGPSRGKRKRPPV